MIKTHTYTALRSVGRVASSNVFSNSFMALNGITVSRSYSLLLIQCMLLEQRTWYVLALLRLLRYSLVSAGFLGVTRPWLRSGWPQLCLVSSLDHVFFRLRRNTFPFALRVRIIGAVINLAWLSVGWLMIRPGGGSVPRETILGIELSMDALGSVSTAAGIFKGELGDVIGCTLSTLRLMFSGVCGIAWLLVDHGLRNYHLAPLPNLLGRLSSEVSLLRVVGTTAATVTVSSKLIIHGLNEFHVGILLLGNSLTLIDNARLPLLTHSGLLAGLVEVWRVHNDTVIGIVVMTVSVVMCEALWSQILLVVSWAPLSTCNATIDPRTLASSLVRGPNACRIQGPWLKLIYSCRPCSCRGPTLLKLVLKLNVLWVSTHLLLMHLPELFTDHRACEYLAAIRHAPLCLEHRLCLHPNASISHG